MGANNMMGIPGVMEPTSLAHGMAGGPLNYLDQKINKLGEKVENNKDKIYDARLESIRGDMLAIGLAAK